LCLNAPHRRRDGFAELSITLDTGQSLGAEIAFHQGIDLGRGLGIGLSDGAGASRYRLNLAGQTSRKSNSPQTSARGPRSRASGTFARLPALEPLHAFYLSTHVAPIAPK
jgi:hypothetical protein